MHTIHMEYHNLINIRRITGLLAVIRTCENISSEKKNIPFGLFLYYSFQTYSTNYCDTKDILMHWKSSKMHNF